MPPKNKKNAPLSTPKRGTYMSRSKAQPPPEFQSNEELTSTDESSTMMEFRQMLGTLTTALATMGTRMDQFSQDKASQVNTTSAQPGTRAGGNHPVISLQAAVLSAQPGTRSGGNSTAASLQMALVSAQLKTRAGGTTTASTSTDLDMEQNIRNMVEH